LDNRSHGSNRRRAPPSSTVLKIMVDANTPAFYAA
jgi:hypothetical protein